MAKRYLNRESIEVLLSVPVPSDYEYDTDTDSEEEVTEPTEYAQQFGEDAENEERLIEMDEVSCS